MQIQPNVYACGREWLIEPIPVNEQFEVEVILVKLGAPPLAAGVAAVVENLAPTIVSMLRDTVGEGEAFDLAKIGDIDTADPRLEASWQRILESLSNTAGDVVREAIPTLVHRLDHLALQRLFQVAVLTKACVLLDGVPSRVADWKTASAICRSPGDKYELLGSALAVTYGRASGDEDDEADEAEAEGV